MKQKYVPLEKRSKKPQKEHHAQQRKTWGNLNPVTKKVPNAKVYNRKKAGRWELHESSGLFVLIYNFY